MSNFALDRDQIFENFGDYVPQAEGEVDPADIDRFIGQQIKLQAMSSLLSWIDDWNHEFKTLDAMLLGIADMDGDEEISKDEEDFYNDLLAGVGDAMLELGADRNLVDKFLNDEDSQAGKKIAEFLADKLNLMDTRPDELVINHGLAVPMVMESTETIIRGGQVVIKKKRVRKKKITSLQKQAAKKNLRKAMSGLSRQKRERSLRIGKNRGIYR